MRVSLRLLFLLGLAAIALAACSDGGAEADAEVRMLDNTFAPEVIEIEPGQTVSFTNDGAVPHNAIANDESWSTEDTFGELLMQPDDTTTVTFDEPGVYDYFCSLHATRNEDGTYEGMTGTIIVGDAADAADVVGEDTDAPDTWTGTTRNVPSDYPTIQSAVDAAAPGDLVLVGPGTYREAVSVTTPGLVIRGTDRNEVVLDGELTRENGIFVTADGVAIENMTARNYTTNGFFWDGVTGYRGSYLTAIDNWVYGIYAFDAVDGLFEHSYASGSWDAGFYIGQCDPCNAVLTDSLAEYNGLGYSGTNSSGDIYIVNSEWRLNQAGIVPNSLDSELLPPVNDVYVGGNYIHSNGASPDVAPYRTAEWSATGNGVVLAGSVGSLVEKNLIVNNPSSGVMVVTNIDKNFWPSTDNIVRDNEILGSGRADVSFGGPAATGSCLEGENGESTVPTLAGLLHRCDGINPPMYYGLATSSEPLARIVEYNFGAESPLAHGDAPDPELDFESLPSDAEVVPAVDVFASLDFDPAAIQTPELPSGMAIDDRHLVILGVDTQAGLWPVVMGALLWWIPLVVWVLGGIWALGAAWRREASAVEKLLWTLVVILIPAVGVVLFSLFGNRDAPAANRWIGSLTGLILWLGAVAGILIMGGVF